MIQFTTSEFELSHGRRPRGHGTWAFEARATAKFVDKVALYCPANIARVEFDAGKLRLWVYRSTYSDAKRAAATIIRAAAPNASGTFTVCP